MNIIFLDIDGPLLPGKMHLFHQPKNKNTAPYFDPFAVRCVNLWSKYSNAEIVLSTNWVWSMSVETIQIFMKENGLELKYHEDSVTPKRFSSSRHSEILSWLLNHQDITENDRFLIVDDDNNCQYVQQILKNHHPNFLAHVGWIKVDYTDGITYKDFKQGCEILNIDNESFLQQEFDITPLTEEEKEQRRKDLELLTKCII